MHASIDFMNGKSVTCQLCKTILRTFETWNKHRLTHTEADAKDKFEPPPSKKAKTGYTKRTDHAHSPIPGHSHWSPPQIGRSVYVVRVVCVAGDVSITILTYIAPREQS